MRKRPTTWSTRGRIVEPRIADLFQDRVSRHRRRASPELAKFRLIGLMRTTGRLSQHVNWRGRSAPPNSNSRLVYCPNPNPNATTQTGISWARTAQSTPFLTLSVVENSIRYGAGCKRLGRLRRGNDEFCHPGCRAVSVAQSRRAPRRGSVHGLLPSGDWPLAIPSMCVHGKWGAAR